MVASKGANIATTIMMTSSAAPARAARRPAIPRNTGRCPMDSTRTAAAEIVSAKPDSGIDGGVQQVRNEIGERDGEGNHEEQPEEEGRVPCLQGSE